MLTPTTIYVQPVIEILKQKHISIHGLAHITGGSFTKLARLNKEVRYNLDNLPKAHGIFKQIQIDGRIKTKEMYKTFNMGIGFCIILPKHSVDAVISIFKKYNMGCSLIGIVDEKEEKENVIANIDGKNEVL